CRPATVLHPRLTRQQALGTSRTRPVLWKKEKSLTLSSLQMTLKRMSQHSAALKLFIQEELVFMAIHTENLTTQNKGLEEVCTELDTLFPTMVAIRRHLHQHPELSHQEVATPKYIADYYRELGLEVREGVGGRGVVAKFEAQ